jgi:prepilin signal peptidase PulO-like enzyme (type II secretory pathway)
VISLPIVIIDLKYYIIPDELNLSIFILGLFVAFFNVFFRGDSLNISILSLHLDSLSITSNFFDSFMGVFVGFLIFGGIYYSSLIIFKKEGMGWGDVKLSVSLGAFLGSSPSIIAFLLSFLLGSVFGIFITALKRLKNYKKIKVIYLLKDLSVSSDVFTSLVRSYLYDIELDQLKTNYIAFGPYMILGAWISIFLAKFIADFFVGEII